MKILVATGEAVLVIDPMSSSVRDTRLPARGPTFVAADPFEGARVWCGTHEEGVFASDDGGSTWRACGLAGERVTCVAASPAADGLLWVGTEPSAVHRSEDGGRTWRRMDGLEDLPSSTEWSFPPRPDTHHVRWIGCHPADSDTLWVAIEAGALVGTTDGGRTWSDRVPGGPFDTHELAIHPDRPDTLHSAAGDGYFRSDDGGVSWIRPQAGMEVGYLRSVVLDPGDPDVVIVSAASYAHAAYVRGRSDGRLYRRSGSDPWQRVRAGWPDPPRTIAPLLAAGYTTGELWAADERGLHRSGDGGIHWDTTAAFATPPKHLRGIAVLKAD